MPRKKKEDVENISEKVEANGSVETKKEATSAKKQGTKGSVDGKTDADGKGKRKSGRSKKVENVEAELVNRGGKGVNGNLIPFDQRTESEQREIRSAGGIRSGQVRRNKKELREFTQGFLLQDAAPVLQNNMKVLGVESEDMTNLAAMGVRLFNKAVNQGDLNSARTLIEWAGMAPLQQERENEAIAKMSQAMQMVGDGSNTDDGMDDVVFYIPFNGRTVITDDDVVNVGEVIE